MPKRLRSWRMPSITSLPGASGRDSTFSVRSAPVASSKAQKSANVPPMSTPTRYPMSLPLRRPGAKPTIAPPGRAATGIARRVAVRPLHAPGTCAVERARARL